MVLCSGLRAGCSDLENPKGAGQIESIAPGWVCQQCWINSSQEKPVTREEGLEKRKGEIYFRGWQPGKVAGSGFNN